MRVPERDADGYGVVLTGYAPFDTQLLCPVTGTVRVPGQTSGFIRSRKETRCIGHNFEPGQLRESDLKPFGRLPEEVLQAVISQTESYPAILYQFHHVAGDDLITHGYILTRTDFFCHELLARFVTGPTAGSPAVVGTMEPYIANPEGTGDRFFDQGVLPYVRRLTGRVNELPEEIRESIICAAVVISEWVPRNRPGEAFLLWKALGSGKPVSRWSASPHGVAVFELLAGRIDGQENGGRVRAEIAGLLERLPDTREHGVRATLHVMDLVTADLADPKQKLSASAPSSDHPSVASPR